MTRRIIAVLFGISALLTLTACGGDSSSEGTKETSTVIPCIDITAVGRKTESEVSAVLGEPIAKETSSFSDGAVQNTYQDSTEILFVNDSAVRITIYPPEGSRVEDGASLLGLSEEQSKVPSYDNSENYYWSDNTEYYKIIAFNDGSGAISYIYVITDEAYQ